MSKVEQRYFEDGQGTWTPWGCAQYSAKLLRGIVFYSTSRHGGLKVTRKIGDKYLSFFSLTNCCSKTEDAYWFEEDGDINVALFELSCKIKGFRALAQEIFSGMKDVESMKESVIRSFPNYSEELLSMNVLD